MSHVLPRGRAQRIVPVLVGLGLALSAVAWSGYPSNADDSGSAFTGHVTATRIHLVNGGDQTVDTRNVSVAVSQTKDLRNFQQIDVSWSGAHPTGGLVADQNSAAASEEEYPVVLLECWGTDSADAPSNQRLDPTTCWTAAARERYQDSFNTAFPPFRVDRYAPAGQRTALVGAPDTRPQACFTPAPVEHWVPFRTPAGKTYPGGSGGCAGMAPESANVGGLSLPSNTTYGVTNADGTGSAKFDVWTAENNASLGCSQQVACSLVIVPVMGISCDVAAADLPPADRPAPGDPATTAANLCQATGQFKPGQVVVPAGREDLAVSGALWWSSSNWRNRITVPLQFAPASNACDVVGAKAGVDLYGSELMTQAATQWLPHFCLDPKLFTVKHVQTGEPEARNLLESGGIEAALSSDVPDGGFSKPVVSAPVGVTGFAIAFSVDDATGHRVASLKLTPRLLAKLLTQSYPAINGIKQEYAALSHNPLDISQDPEFQALNPGIAHGVPASQSASTLLALSSDSDVMNALTAYINADPEARAWLDGSADPWGMVVNPNYRGIALPKDSWPLLDSFQPPKLYASDTNDCLFHNPVPFLPLVAAPLPHLAPIALDVEFALANSQTVCQQVADGTSDGEKLVAVGRQTPGFRFMLGVTALADARRYGLDVASLQTQVASSAPTAFTSADGRSFVAPTNDSLHAAAALLTNDPVNQTWPIPYDALRTAPGGAAAYPGTMVVYAQVPTTGLPAEDAHAYAQLLRFVVGDGQTPGSVVGTLPDGYLPMTAGNDLGALSKYTLAAADAVDTQSGDVPVLTALAGAGSDGSSAGAGTSGADDAVSTGLPASPLAAIHQLGTAPLTSAIELPPPAAPGQHPGVIGAVIGKTLGVLSHVAGFVLPALLLLGVGSGIASLVVYVLGRLQAAR